MNRQPVSLEAELIIERNAYRAFIECIVNDVYDRVSPGLKAEAQKVLDGYDHPGHEVENYQG